MTVKELIEKLSKFPEDLSVLLHEIDSDIPRYQVVGFKYTMDARKKTEGLDILFE